VNAKLKSRLAKLERQRVSQPEAESTIQDTFADVEAQVDALQKSVETGKPPARPDCIPELAWNAYLQALAARLGKPETVAWGPFLQRLGCADDTSIPSRKNSSGK
jgi:hypothetical protein